METMKWGLGTSRGAGGGGKKTWCIELLFSVFSFGNGYFHMCCFNGSLLNISRLVKESKNSFPSFKAVLVLVPDSYLLVCLINKLLLL